MMGLYSSGALGGVEVLEGAVGGLVGGELGRGLVGGELTAHVLSAQAAAHAAAAAHQQQQIAVQQISEFNFTSINNEASKNFNLSYRCHEVLDCNKCFTLFDCLNIMLM